MGQLCLRKFFKCSHYKHIGASHPGDYVSFFFSAAKYIRIHVTQGNALPYSLYGNKKSARKGMNLTNLKGDQPRATLVKFNQNRSNGFKVYDTDNTD